MGPKQKPAVVNNEALRAPEPFETVGFEVVGESSLIQLVPAAIAAPVATPASPDLSSVIQRLPKSSTNGFPVAVPDSVRAKGRLNHRR